jgi:hypothetical protein
MFSKKLASAAPKAATEGPKAVTEGPKAATEGTKPATEGPKPATEGPKAVTAVALEPTVADVIQALQAMEPGTAAASFKGAFEAHGMDEAAPIGDYLDRVAGDAVGWLRSLPGSRSAEWRACKGAMMMLRDCPGVVDSVGKKLGKMENALKKAMSNAGINEETARRTAEAYLSKGGDTVAEVDTEESEVVEPDDTERLRLRAAVTEYCAAKELTGVAAVLAALWTPDSPLESVEKLETVFRTVACDDPVALKVFDVLRSKGPEVRRS